MVAGDLGPRRAARLQAHLADCTSCQTLAGELSDLRSWSTGLGGLADLAPENYLSVRQAVRARVAAASAPAGVSAWRPAWAVLAPLAGVVMMAAVLVLGGGSPAGPEAPLFATADGDGAVIEMSPLEDAAEAMLSIQNGPNAVHQVAVSTHDPRFTNALVFQVQGDRWIDPTPNPAPGQVIFYRVD